MQNILGYFVGGAKYPRILCMGVQNILGYFVGRAKYPGIFCRGVQNFGGYKISFDTGSLFS